MTRHLQEDGSTLETRTFLAPLSVLLLGHTKHPVFPPCIHTWAKPPSQGWMDSEGYLTLTGRIKELINRGGEKISPLEVGMSCNTANGKHRLVEA